MAAGARANVIVPRPFPGGPLRAGMQPPRETDGGGPVATEPAAGDESGGRSTPERESTTVDVRCTGHVRDAVGTGQLHYTFPGSTLRAFLESFFADFDVREMLIAETEADATAPGWAPRPTRLPGDWRKNPEGEQTRPFVRVLVNGTFNEHLEGLDTVLTDGDRVALMYPFVFCV